MGQRFIGMAAAVVLSGVLGWMAFAAEPAPQPRATGSNIASLAGNGPVARPAPTQIANPAALDVAKLKFVGLLGDPRFRHAGRINSISVVAGGKQILSCADDGAARLWDAVSGQELRRIQYGKAQREVDLILHGAALLPDGKRLLTCRRDELTLWDLETGNVVRTMKHASQIYGLAVSPDGRQAFTGGNIGVIVQWDVETGREVRQFPGPRHWVRALAISPDGKTLITGGQDQSIRIWNTVDGHAQRTLTVHTDQIDAVAFSPDGGKFASVSYDKTVRLWDLATVLKTDTGSGKELWQATLSDAPVRVAFSPDGQMLALGCNGCIRLLSSRNGEVLRTIALANPYYPEVAFSGNGKEVLASEGVVICRWDCATGQRIFPSAAPGKTMYGSTGKLALAPDGHRLYSSGLEGQSTGLWDLRRNELEDVWKMQEDLPLSSLQLSADGQRLLVGAGEHAAILDTQTGKPQRQFIGDRGDEPWFWGQGDKSVIAVSDEAPLKIFNVEDGSGRPVGSLARPRFPAAVPRFLPRVLTIDGKHRLVVCGEVNVDRLTFWSLTTESKLGELRAGEVTAAQWLPGGGSGGHGLLTVGEDGALRYWYRQGAATRPAPRGDALAVWVKNLASDDFEVREEATAKLIEAGAEVDVEAALAEADLTDAEVVARLVRVRRTLEKNAVPEALIGQPLTLGQSITVLTANPDGRHWAAILDRGAASVVVLGEVTPQGPKELRRLSGEGHGPCGLLFSPDGTTLYVGNGNATISIYRAE